MKYYKYLDLDWHSCRKQLLHYVQVDCPSLSIPDSSSWRKPNLNDVLEKVPQLPVVFQPLNLTIRYVAFFVSNYQYGTIHIDADTISKARINLPVLNCENTETRFYTTSGMTNKIFQDNGVSLMNIDPGTCTHVDQFYLTQPVVFRNTHPHQVVSNNVNHPRISCTVAFNEDIEYLLE
jgi:hypothetical protein